MRRVLEGNLCREAIPLSWFHTGESRFRLLVAPFRAIYKLGQPVSYNHLSLCYFYTIELINAIDWNNHYASITHLGFVTVEIQNNVEFLALMIESNGVTLIRFYLKNIESLWLVIVRRRVHKQAHKTQVF